MDFLLSFNSDLQYGNGIGDESITRLDIAGRGLCYAMSCRHVMVMIERYENTVHDTHVSYACRQSSGIAYQ